MTKRVFTAEFALEKEYLKLSKGWLKENIEIKNATEKLIVSRLYSDI